MANGRNKKKKASSVSRTKLTPEYEAAYGRACALQKVGDLSQADQLYQAILKAFPDHASSWHNLGILAASMGKPDIALDFIGKAIDLNGRVAEYHFNLGTIYAQLEQYQNAIASFQHALRLNPRYVQAYENLGVTFQDVDRYEQAEAAYRHAIELNPKSIAALRNLGTLLYRGEKTEAALEYFQKALSVSPADPDLHLKSLSAYMKLERFSAGWSEHEWRFNASAYRQYNRIVPRGLPTWGGESLSNSRVLVAAEQGIGDEVMFSTFFPDIIAETRECIIECDARLVSLFKRSFPGASRVVSRDEPPVSADVYFLAGSYPSYRHKALDDFRHQSAPLFADPDKRNTWRDRLAKLPAKECNIGISWRGGIDKRAAKARSLSLSSWKRLIESTSANFVNLQYGDHREEIDSFNSGSSNPLIQFNDLDVFNDIDNLCALIAELDLIISVDNATVHFAGALGKPVWILLPVGPEWRWLDKREDTLWYPKACLFRTSAHDASGWPAVFDRVQKLLSANQLDIGQKEVTAESLVKDAAQVEVSSGNEAANCSLLINDTCNWAHWGHSCSTLGVYGQARRLGSSFLGAPTTDFRQLKALPDSLEAFDSEQQFREFRELYPGLIEKMEKANQILLNGGGNLIGVGPLATGLLYLAYVAKKRMGKHVSLVNHSCFPNGTANLQQGIATDLYRKVYQALDYVAVREPLSHELLKKMGIDSTLSFDCLPLFIERYFEFDNIQREDRSILVCGSVGWRAPEIANVAGFVSLLNEHGYSVKVLVGAAAYMASDDVEFVRQLQQHAADKFELIYAKSESEWLSTIATSALLVSGRFHHSIAAAFLGTPFLVSQSNTPKIEGLLQSLELSSPLYQAADISGEELLRRAEACLANPEPYLITQETRKRLLARSALNFPDLLSQ